MVANLVMTALLVAIGVGVACALAEWLHGRRVAKVAHLAFGVRGKPRRWVHAAPWIRVVGLSLACWGFVILAMQQPEVVETEPSSEASQHLLVCLDASPSMYVADAGPAGDQKRAVWAGEVVQAILDRLDTDTTRVTVVAIYTKAIPVIEDTFDVNVVRNLLDGLPLFAAFEPGSTLLSEGVAEAMDLARQWEPDSATLLVISDGDAKQKPIRLIPASIADAIVIGVGDPVSPTLVAGHRSKQDMGSLKALASQLNGFYYQGNTKHLPSGVLDRLTMIKPRLTDSIGLREAALLSIGFGSFLLAAVGPALTVLGRRSAHARTVVRGPGRTIRASRATAMRGGA